jgi:hypothetical protein
LCGAGFYSDAAGSVCRACNEGSFSNPNSSICQKCSPDKFSGTAASFCTTCSGGTYSLEAAGGCIHCDNGAFSPANASMCTECSSGSYFQFSASVCIICQAGEYSGTGAYIRVDERPGITHFIFYSWGPRFVTRFSKSIQWFAQACAPKWSGRYQDEFRLERNSCLVLNFSTCAPSFTNIVQQNFIQEQTASFTTSSTPLISILLDTYLIHFFLEICHFFSRFYVRSLEYSYVFSDPNIHFGRRYVPILKTLQFGVSEA